MPLECCPLASTTCLGCSRRRLLQSAVSLATAPARDRSRCLRLLRPQACSSPGSASFGGVGPSFRLPAGLGWRRSFPTGRTRVGFHCCLLPAPLRAANVDLKGSPGGVGRALLPLLSAGSRGRISAGGATAGAGLAAALSCGRSRTPREGPFRRGLGSTWAGGWP